MKFNIPSIGDQVKLIKDWNAPIPVESRNDKFICLMDPSQHDNVKKNMWYWYEESKKPMSFVNVVIPKGTQLTVDRIYIRKGKKEFDSISFVVTELPGKELGKKIFGIRARFWVKLAELKNLTFKEVSSQH